VADDLDVTLVEEARAELVRLTPRKPYRDHLHELVVRRRVRIRAEESSELCTCAHRETVAPRAHVIPVMLGLEVDRCGDCEARGRIVRARPAVAIGPRVLGPVPADGERLEQLLRLGPRVEKAGALRGTEPLVAIADVEVGAGVLER